MKCPSCGEEIPFPAALLEAGPLRMDLLRREATVGGEVVRLVGKNWALLELFLRNPDRVLSRGAIANLWRFEPSRNLMDKHISRLRAIIGSRFLETVPLVGWRLRVDQESSPERSSSG